LTTRNPDRNYTMSGQARVWYTEAIFQCGLATLAFDRSYRSSSRHLHWVYIVHPLISALTLTLALIYSGLQRRESARQSKIVGVGTSSVIHIIYYWKAIPGFYFFKTLDEIYWNSFVVAKPCCWQSIKTLYFRELLRCWGVRTWPPGGAASYLPGKVEYGQSRFSGHDKW